MPSRGVVKVEAELEVGIEPELEAEASRCLGFFNAFCVGFAALFFFGSLGSSGFTSAGAEARAAAPATASALVSLLLASAVVSAVAEVAGGDWVTLELPERHPILSARPVGAGTVSPFPRTPHPTPSPEPASPARHRGQDCYRAIQATRLNLSASLSAFRSGAPLDPSAAALPALYLLETARPVRPVAPPARDCSCDGSTRARRSAQA